ncbi:uncharacterized protein RJT20DRAFT_130705 [Scheffersomyces xylosifermentans]|uniref:uncharacterized protein n=1 Tax=Scheffersomyces xylosifermentans TaxID=1304137 RepID=UPI00315D267E
MQDRYLSETVYQRRLRIANEIHKRDYSRLSSSWYPLSIYKAYTNIKTDLDNTDYHKFVPRKSCFGKINMRSKRAWPRGPKRECAEESEHLGGPIIDNVRGSQRFAPY